eukprot:gene5368-7118_t
MTRIKELQQTHQQLRMHSDTNAKANIDANLASYITTITASPPPQLPLFL